MQDLEITSKREQENDVLFSFIWGDGTPWKNHFYDGLFSQAIRRGKERLTVILTVYSVGEGLWHVLCGAPGLQKFVGRIFLLYFLYALVRVESAHNDERVLEFGEERRGKYGQVAYALGSLL